MTIVEAVRWTDDGAGVRIIDQTRLPAECVARELRTVDDVCEAIAALRVRGAPAIGIAGAMGLVAALQPHADDPVDRFRWRAASYAERIAGTRPTAVNLPWAVGRLRRRLDAARGDPPALLAELRAEAELVLAEDRAMCQRIGEHALPLVPNGARVLTHCNAGALATGGIGTALAPLYLAAALGRRIEVLVDETRPLLQGSRLTAWELSRAGIPVTVLTDGMVASRLRRGDIACVLVGADRIAANGDVANKIGTYAVALAARAHAVPFYVAAPRSTFDFDCPTGAAIPIEERSPDEIRCVGGRATVPVGADIWNPAFDVTPAELVTGYITDAGLLNRERLSAIRYPPSAGAGSHRGVSDLPRIADSG